MVTSRRGTRTRTEHRIFKPAQNMWHTSMVWPGLHELLSSQSVDQVHAVRIFVACVGLLMLDPCVVYEHCIRSPHYLNVGQSTPPSWTWPGIFLFRYRLRKACAPTGSVNWCRSWLPCPSDWRFRGSAIHELAGRSTFNLINIH